MPMPGTDAALALGMMQVLISEDLIDHNYIADHTVGFDELARRAAEYPPEKASAICSVPTNDIRSIAIAYGHNYLRLARPVIPPVGQSRTNRSIFQELARRMGFEEEVFSLGEVLINPQNAQERDISQGDLVRVFNDRGECCLYAEVTSDTQPGLLVAEGLHWPRLAPGGKGANQLTSQGLTDQGETCAFHCNLVEVEPGYPVAK